MTTRKKKTNVLLICSDQHNPEISGCYGNKIIDTPNIDRLSQEGTTFDSAYCNCPICVPSRLSFLSGLYPFEIECLGNDSVLDSIVPTYAHMAAIAGYHTMLSGRMHFQGPDQRHGFVERLVGDCAPYEFWGRKNDLAPLNSKLGNMSLSEPLSQVGAGNTSRLDYDLAVTEASCLWLQNYAKNPEVPFMMTVGLMAPHCPYIAPPNLYDKYKERVFLHEVEEEHLESLHPIHKKYRESIDIENTPFENQLKAKIAYYCLVDFLDSQVGRILETLENTGLLDNTIIVYFSDHGEMLGSHGRWHKGCFFEDSTRVPVIIRMPNSQNAGKRIDQHISLIDLFPTICEWTGAKFKHEIRGDSLMPLINNELWTRKNLIKVEYYEGDCQRMIRCDEWKFCYYSNYPDNYELYNLKEDPDELINRAKDPDCEILIKKLLAEIFNDGWNDDVLKNRDQRLSRFDYWQFSKNFGEAVMQNPLLPTSKDYWSGDKSKNYLRTQRDNSLTMEKL